MPIDASNPPAFVGPLDAEAWEKLQTQLFTTSSKYSSDAVFTSEVFGFGATPEACYLFGLTVAAKTHDDDESEKTSETISSWQRQLSRLATHPSDAETTIEPLDADELIQRVAAFLKTTPVAKTDLSTALEAILWASAMVPLTRLLPQEIWWQLLSHLQQYRAEAALEAEPRSANYLLLAGELGITLAWRLPTLPSCGRIRQASLDAVSTFLEGEGDSIDRVLTRPQDLRLVVASLVRCERLFPIVSKRKFKKRYLEIAAEFATWMAALNRQDGSQVFTPTTGRDVKWDVKPPKSIQAGGKKHTKKRAKSSKNKLANNSVDLLGGLMRAASCFDVDTLVPAIAASLGQSHSGGRLAWEVSLPEAMWHAEEGKLVVMLPEWDVRRGRSFIDYSGEDMRVEIVGGRSSVFAGVHQTMVQVDGNAAHPKGPWEVTCEYSDDDVHMIEMEQPFTNGVVLQRQWMVVREDRCVMVSDAVLPAKPDGSAESKKAASDHVASEPIHAPELVCISRLPLAGEIEVVSDDEVREFVLTQRSKPRCKVLPLAASEWHVGPSDAKVSVSDDRHLVVETRGVGAIYSPIWMDFQPRRFGRPSTWRTLTIADNLQTVGREVAAGFRVQAGSEHWVIYRSLSGRKPRSFMGKHIVADFFAARFHPGDGGMEELVTVDESDVSK
ncbi:hypothetical protein [Neorhodopirellula pilleata]|uniref:Uncharacterized protein n=1 Tax=Neorhodopirellula pilleata TaxID=2714738 RepID=A0A5C5ZG61_9BACT|nr:hypothetical protein [Neorhodopirellula pilleata]TWT86128.1 hypothetical protein Pla100_61730 [Neorhodopirellula pilleata]